MTDRCKWCGQLWHKGVCQEQRKTETAERIIRSLERLITQAAKEEVINDLLLQEAVYRAWGQKVWRQP